MADLIKFIVEFFTYKGLHIGYRFSIAILTLFSILVLNDIIGVSRNYMLNSRLEQIIKLKQIDPDILKDDSIVNRNFLLLKSEIINNRSKTEDAIKYFKDLAITFYPNKQAITQQTISAKKLKTKINPSFADIGGMAFFYLLITVGIILIIVAVFDKISTKEKISLIGTFFVAMICIYFLGRLYTHLVSLITLIPNYEWINYLIYFAAPILLIVLGARVFRKRKKKISTESV